MRAPFGRGRRAARGARSGTRHRAHARSRSCLGCAGGVADSGGADDSAEAGQVNHGGPGARTAPVRRRIHGDEQGDRSADENSRRLLARGVETRAWRQSGRTGAVGGRSGARATLGRRRDVQRIAARRVARLKLTHRVAVERSGGHRACSPEVDVGAGASHRAGARCVATPLASERAD